jgi:hypothetical protein
MPDGDDDDAVATNTDGDFSVTVVDLILENVAGLLEYEVDLIIVGMGGLVVTTSGLDWVAVMVPSPLPV